jgi:hypothetical protein
MKHPSIHPIQQKEKKENEKKIALRGHKGEWCLCALSVMFNCVYFLGSFFSISSNLSCTKIRHGSDRYNVYINMYHETKNSDYQALLIADQFFLNNVF